MPKETAPNPQAALANERTFLAWIRTALALMVTGVALVAFEVPIQENWRTASAAVFVLLGVFSAIQAWLGWRATDAALRKGAEVPVPSGRLIVVAGTVLGAVLLTVGFVIA